MPLAAEGPDRRLPALPPRRGPGQLHLRPGLPVAPPRAAGGRPRRGRRAVGAGLPEPVADLGRPPAAARAHVAADPRQGRPAPRRRAPRGRPRHGRRGRLEPRRPPGRRVGHRARPAAGRRRRRRARRPRPARLGRPHGLGRPQGAGARRARGARRPALRLGAGARRRGGRRAGRARACWPTSTSPPGCAARRPSPTSGRRSSWRPAPRASRRSAAPAGTSAGSSTASCRG